jgi:uncharacterized lipoprotein YehR (DUF1307 family)
MKKKNKNEIAKMLNSLATRFDGLSVGWRESQDYEGTKYQDADITGCFDQMYMELAHEMRRIAKMLRR